ncbi:uncharacterized protein LOC106177205 [Lingula anatina]|uniref:Uncharacterized protein LOC106177205 n=1 Tax=Lingula anatina TaxID=7574 RepID=A0A1S3JY74_LINAN|nr:uncharacterized protein LOC106177205 [Lingula anatina]|eukprot:XP_013415365.1 uncharacterized protein LOC106177205 [Lingula anatina]
MSPGRCGGLMHIWITLSMPTLMAATDSWSYQESEHLKNTTLTKATERNVSPTADWRPYTVKVRRKLELCEKHAVIRNTHTSTLDNMEEVWKAIANEISSVAISTRSSAECPDN